MNTVQARKLKKIVKKSKRSFRRFKALKAILKNRGKIGTAVYSVLHLVLSKK